MADTLGLTNNLGININVDQIINTTAITGLIVIGFVIVAVILLVWWYISKHDKKVILHFKTGNGWVIKENKGEKNIKKRTFKLLYNRSIQCTYPESRNLVLWKGKEAYEGIVVNDVCTWLEIVDSKLIAPDQNLMNFQAEQFMMTDEATKTQQSWWDKFGSAAIMISMLILFIFGMFLILQQVKNAIEMGQSVMAACQQVGMRAFQNTTQIL